MLQLPQTSALINLYKRQKVINLRTILICFQWLVEKRKKVAAAAAGSPIEVGERGAELQSKRGKKKCPHRPICSVANPAALSFNDDTYPISSTNGHNMTIIIVGVMAPSYYSSFLVQSMNDSPNFVPHISLGCSEPPSAFILSCNVEKFAESHFGTPKAAREPKTNVQAEKEREGNWPEVIYFALHS